jgi:hypothetical protein
MHCFEILIAGSAVSRGGGPFVPDDQLTYGIPDEAQALLDPILGPYNQSPMWYFDKLNFGLRPAPWALACLGREYAIGGHVATSRPPNAGIAFTSYSQVPEPMPDDFVPRVGVVTFESKSGLERSAGNSPLFAAAWNALRECSLESRWLVILDPLAQEWLAQVFPGDRERWLSRRRQ